jgi:hypothetical protein
MFMFGTNHWVEEGREVGVQGPFRPVETGEGCEGWVGQDTSLHRDSFGVKPLYSRKFSHPKHFNLEDVGRMYFRNSGNTVHRG